VWVTTTRTRVSDATSVTFSVKCFNRLKLYHLSGNIFRKWFASYFLSRVSMTRDIEEFCLSVRPSVRNVPVLDENGLTYCHSFYQSLYSFISKSGCLLLNTVRFLFLVEMQIAYSNNVSMTTSPTMCFCRLEKKKKKLFSGNINKKEQQR